MVRVRQRTHEPINKEMRNANADGVSATYLFRVAALLLVSAAIELEVIVRTVAIVSRSAPVPIVCMSPSMSYPSAIATLAPA